MSLVTGIQPIEPSSSALHGDMLRRAPMKMLFVAMPFGAIRPAMGASLLAGHLKRLDIEARVEYLNMSFLREIGAVDYEYISDRAPSQSLAGDWVFAEALHGKREDKDSQYLESFLERFTKFHHGASSLEVLKRARKKAGAFIDRCVEQVRWSSFDVIGFTSSFTQHAASLALARAVKTLYPHLPIIFGGANCEEAMGLSLHQTFDFVDFVCSGEADISLPRLLNALRTPGADRHGIPGVISRRNGESTFSSLAPETTADMDSLPYPDFDDYFAQYSDSFPKAPKNQAKILMESSRGCWWGQKHHCTFCGLNGTTMKFRSKSAERVLDEIKTLSRRYGAVHIEMVDNILDMAYFKDLLPQLTQAGLHIEFFYETKANLRRNQLETMREAGISAIQPGIESLSSGVLRIMRKGTTAAQNIQLLKWCSEMEIDVHWNLIYGFPGEDPDEYRTMIPIIESIMHLSPPHGYGAIRLDRFSPNFQESEKLGLTNVRADRSYRLIYEMDGGHLQNFAYYFEHDYNDGRSPETYIGKTVAAVERWRENHKRNGLVYVDHEEMLAIWDSRPMARQRVVILSGWQRQVYLHCEQHRMRKSLLDSFAASATEQELDLFLATLIESRQMLAIDGGYLALAVRWARETKMDSQAKNARELCFF
jgi:ribosomal peptide maturation radical SAM protein 1